MVDGELFLPVLVVEGRSRLSSWFLPEISMLCCASWYAFDYYLSIYKLHSVYGSFRPSGHEKNYIFC